MEIIFYNNLSEKNVIEKTLDNSYTLVGELRESTSVKNPTFIVEGSEFIAGFNYCFIPDFNRYYFISDIKSMRVNLWQISLKVDVLMSFQDDILATSAIIDHTTQEDVTDYLDSYIWQSLVKDKTDIINFSHGLSETGGYVLITAGG